jgi:hypothetical protein
VGRRYADVTTRGDVEAYFEDVRIKNA